MRRTDRELTGISELRAILDQCDAMRIAGQDAEGFFIFPVNFGYTVEGDKLTLYFHSATEGRKARLYAPTIAREQAALRETESLLRRVYRGNLGMLVNTLADTRGLTREDIDELSAILEKAKEGQV